MEKELIFALASGILFLISTLPYFRDMLRGKTTPHPFSTGIWLILVGFTCYVLWSDHEYFGLIPWGIIVLSLIVRFIFGIKYIKTIPINWFDYTCLALSIGTLIYYWISRDTLMSIILAALIDLIAFLPTFKKAWIQPWSETLSFWLIGALVDTLTIASLISPIPETVFFWGSAVVSHVVFVLMVVIRRYYLRWWSSIYH
jgi:hypothetical protein